MRFKTLFFISFVVLGLNIFAQQKMSQIKVEGIYSGKNLYVLNPLLSDSSYCIKEVIVNNKKTRDVLNSSSFEIDFAQLKIEVGTPLSIIINYSDKSLPKIINPEVLKMKNIFTFLSTKVDKTGKLTFCVKGVFDDSPFMVEQFRWNKWVMVGEVKTSDSTKRNIYSLMTHPHSGQNFFRIKKVDENVNQIILSKECKYKAVGKPIILASVKVSDEILFSGETLFELLDEDGNLLQTGFAARVDVSSLAKGKYWINFDDKSEMVTKK